MLIDLFKPVLSDKTIIKYIKKGQLFEGIIDYEQVQPNSVDLTLSSSCKYINPNANLPTDDMSIIPSSLADSLMVIDAAKQIDYISKTASDEILIKPKEFILLASNEVLNIPNGIVGFVQGRSSIARMGIQTEEAGLVDSGFRGSITFEVYNETPYTVKIYPGMRIAQIYFLRSQKSARLYGKEHGSKYSGQLVATGTRIWEDPEMSKHRSE